MGRIFERERPATVVEMQPYGMRVAQGLERATTDVYTFSKGVIASEEPVPVPEPHAIVGGDDAFIHAWGRNNEALASRTRQLMLSGVLNVGFLILVGFLAYRNEKKETYVFVRDALGNVVQANAEAFLKAGTDRSEVEIKGFVRRWVLDAWTWTPLDVQDRAEAALAVVDGKAQQVVKDGLELGARKGLVEAGVSGRVYDNAATDRQPKAVIMRLQPLEVLVSFERYHIDRTGEHADAGPLFVRAALQQIPRSPSNPYGLVISDLQISDRL